MLVSLLSNPPLLIVGNALHQEREIVYVVNQREDGRLEDLMQLVTQNTKQMTSLIQEKTRQMAHIETMMDLFSYERTTLSKKQMQDFAYLMSYYESANQSLQKEFQNIDENRTLTLLHKDAADYDVICNALDALCAHQGNAIASLNHLIESAKKLSASF